MILKDSLKTIAISLIILSLIGVVYAWTEPTQNPPLGNTAPPINTSADPQIKDGGLDLKSLTVQGGSLFNNEVSISSPTDEILKLTRQGAPLPTTFRTGTDGALVINSGGKDVINIDAAGNFNIKASAYDNQTPTGGELAGQLTPRCAVSQDRSATAFDVPKFITSDPINSICYDWGYVQGSPKSKLFKVLNQNSTDLLSLSPVGLVVNGTGLTVQGPITTSPGGFIFPDGKAQTTVPMSGYETIRTDCVNSRDCIANCSPGKSIISGGCYAAYDDSRYINSSWPNNANSWGCHTQANVTINAYAICANVEGQTMLVNNDHSEAACTVIGGTVDKTSVSGVSFCKFSGSSCPSTWTPYNWSATSANTCTGANVDYYNLFGYVQGTCIGTSTTTGQHSWANNNTIETSSYKNSICDSYVFAYDFGWVCGTCSTPTNTCSATRTQIGCY